MNSWAQVLIFLAVTFAFAADVGAQGFSGPYVDQGGGQESGQGADTAFKPTDRGLASPRSYVAPTGSSAGYKIGPQDVLDISVFGVPELSGTLIVAENGTIQLPLIGETPAAGRTARQLQDELSAKLGAEYLQNPQVRVVVTEFNSRSVILTGQIEEPGVYPLKGRTSLLQLVAAAGGVNEKSDSTVLILRDAGGKRTAARFDLSAIEKGTAKDPILRAGDTVVAGTSAIKKAYSGFLKALGIAGRFAIF